eukprot:1259545-Rhodomonas_salina.1
MRTDQFSSWWKPRRSSSPAPLPPPRHITRSSLRFPSLLGTSHSSSRHLTPPSLASPTLRAVSYTHLRAHETEADR